MDEINPSAGGRKKLFLFAGIFLVIVMLACVFTYGVAWYKDPVRQYAKQQRIIEDAYRNDTYGGKTPQETLDMFIEALKAGDVELASKYFMLDDNLSRKKWEDELRQAKEGGRLEEMLNILGGVLPDPKESLYKNDFGFVIKTANGQIGAEIDMEFNPVSKVWKIESL